MQPPLLLTHLNPDGSNRGTPYASLRPSSSLISSSELTFVPWQLYYFPKETVSFEYLKNAQQSAGGKTKYDLVVADKKAEGAVTLFETGDLAGYVRIAFDAADAWFEEDQRLYVHPKDPYKVSHHPFMSILNGR